MDEYCPECGGLYSPDGSCWDCGQERIRWSSLDEERLAKLEARKDELFAMDDVLGSLDEREQVELAQLTQETLRLRDLRLRNTGSRV